MMVITHSPVLMQQLEPPPASSAIYEDDFTTLDLTHWTANGVPASHGTFSYVDGKVRAPNSWDSRGAYCTLPTSVTMNGIVEADFIARSTVNSGSYLVGYSVYGTGDTNANYFYFGYSGTVSELALGIRLNGSNSDYTSAAYTFEATGVAQRLKLEVDTTGSVTTLTGYVDDVLFLTHDVTTAYTDGSRGIISANGDKVEFDNFAIYDL